MTILLLSQVFPPGPGGSGRWLWELYRRLPNIQVHVAAGKGHGPAVTSAFDQASTLPIDRLPLSLANWGLWHPRSSLQYARALVDLGRMVARIRPDVIHCGKCLPEGLLAAMIERVAGTPFVCYVHGEELSLARTSRELRRLSWKTLHRARRVVANSQHTRSLLLADWQVPADRIDVMTPGVDTSTFVPGEPDVAWRRRQGWDGRRVVLTVGALQKRKGQDMMIRALPAIRARCPDVLYAVAGDGWERPYLDGLVREHGVDDLVQFLGIPADADLIACYQQCDLFALPNRQVGWDFEGFGIVLIEAQACGRAVIAGASGGTAETLRPGMTGELVPCDTPDHLATAVADLLDDGERRARMGSAGRPWTVEHFDWSVLTAQAETLFRGTLTRR